MGMPRSVYDEIVSTDKPGPHNQSAKAEKLRVYLIPKKYTVSGSSSNEDRTLTIYVAIISDSYVYILEDYSRIARMWWKSRSQKWLRHEITVDSPACSNFFPLRRHLLTQFVGRSGIYVHSTVGQIGPDVRTMQRHN